MWGGCGGLVLVLVVCSIHREDKHKAPTLPLHSPLSLHQTRHLLIDHCSYVPKCEVRHWYFMHLLIAIRSKSVHTLINTEKTFENTKTYVNSYVMQEPRMLLLESIHIHPVLRPLSGARLNRCRRIPALDTRWISGKRLDIFMSLAFFAIGFSPITTGDSYHRFSPSVCRCTHHGGALCGARYRPGIEVSLLWQACP